MSKVQPYPLIDREFGPRFIEQVSGYMQEHARALNETPLIPKVVVTGTTHTFRLGDLNYLVDFTSGSAVTATIPPDSSVQFAVGSTIHYCQGGAGQVTVAAGSGVTLRTRPGAKTAGQYAMCSIWKRDVNEWVVFGDVTT